MQVEDVSVVMARVCVRLMKFRELSGVLCRAKWSERMRGKCESSSDIQL